MANSELNSDDMVISILNEALKKGIFRNEADLFDEFKRILDKQGYVFTNDYSIPGDSGGDDGGQRKVNLVFWKKHSEYGFSLPTIKNATGIELIYDVSNVIDCYGEEIGSKSYGDETFKNACSEIYTLIHNCSNKVSSGYVVYITDKTQDDFDDITNRIFPYNISVPHYDECPCFEKKSKNYYVCVVKYQSIIDIVALDTILPH